MKNEMFKHLLEKFATINLSILPGGTLNPDNQWFFDIMNSLSEVAEAVENHETDIKKAAESFQKLKSASEVMLGMGRDGVPKEMQPLFTALLAAQKPLDCYLQNLKNGKTLDEALADPSWLDGLFNSTKAVTEREDYVEGSYTTEGKTYQQIVDTYREDAVQAGFILDNHMKALSGDSYDPDGMLQAKLSLMQDFINAHEGGPQMWDMKSFIESRYTELRSRFNQKNVENLSDNKRIMCEGFFDTEMDALVGQGSLESGLESMKSLGEDALRLLRQETYKLRTKAEKMGFSKELKERFEKNSLSLQAVSRAVDALKYDFDEDSDLSEDETVGPIYNEVTKMLSKVLAYVRGDKEAQLPTDEEFISTSEHVVDFAKNYSLFDKDEERNELLPAFALIAQELCTSVPHLSQKMQPGADLLNTRIKVDALQLQEKLLSHNTSPEQANTIDRQIKKLYSERIIDRDFQLKAIYVRMARDPEFNQKMIEEVSGVISDFAENMENDPGTCKSPLFLKDNKVRNESFTPEQLYQDAYTMYLLGRQIQMENKKLQALKDAEQPEVERIRNPIDPNLEKLITSTAMDESCLKAIDKTVDELRKTKLFTLMQKNGPKVVDTIISQNEASVSMMQSFSKTTGNYLKELNPDSISILSQTSGFAFQKNSESFQKMSDALKEVSKRNLSPEGAATEDYQKLYDAAKNYVLSHDANPRLSNGKKRVGAALNVMQIIGKHLAIQNPDSDFAEQFKEDHAINMARNKDYRNFEIDSAKKQIQTLLSNNAAAYKNRSLPERVKTKIARQLEIVVQGNEMNRVLKQLPGNIIEGKYTDRSVSDKVTDVMDKVNTHCDGVMQKFRADPYSILRHIEPETLRLQNEASQVSKGEEQSMKI